jgi:hypothetical protein
VATREEREEKAGDAIEETMRGDFEESLAANIELELDNTRSSARKAWPSS